MVESTLMTESELKSRAFLYGDAVSVFFYLQESRPVFLEESYFYLMASMRKMRMQIPLSYTLEYFDNLLKESIEDSSLSEGIFHLMVYRTPSTTSLEKAEVRLELSFSSVPGLLTLRESLDLDLIREIHLTANLFSGIHTHSVENIYAEIYAKENDLSDVILLNEHKRIARASMGNLLFLQDGILRIPKQSEGVYISPLMEAFVTFVHKNNLAQIDLVEMAPFESQKAEEILLISDAKGLFSVGKIRNKSFEETRLKEMVEKWRQSLI